MFSASIGADLESQLDNCQDETQIIIICSWLVNKGNKILWCDVIIITLWLQFHLQHEECSPYQLSFDTVHQFFFKYPKNVQHEKWLLNQALLLMCLFIHINSITWEKDLLSQEPHRVSQDQVVLWLWCGHLRASLHGLLRLIPHLSWPHQVAAWAPRPQCLGQEHWALAHLDCQPGTSRWPRTLNTLSPFWCRGLGVQQAQAKGRDWGGLGGLVARGSGPGLDNKHFKWTVEQAFSQV